jgi:hypothetical protein
MRNRWICRQEIFDVAALLGLIPARKGKTGKRTVDAMLSKLVDKRVIKRHKIGPAQSSEVFYRLVGVVAFVAFFATFASLSRAHATDLEDWTMAGVAVVLCQKELVASPAMEAIMSKVEKYPDDSRTRAGAFVTKMVRDMGKEKFCELTRPALSELSRWGQ